MIPRFTVAIVHEKISVFLKIFIFDLVETTECGVLQQTAACRWAAAYVAEERIRVIEGDIRVADGSEEPVEELVVEEYGHCALRMNNVSG